jgi:hypothetical protein
MVGYYFDASNNVHGFLKVGDIYTPFDYPGANATYPSGINTSGQIVGTYSDASGGHGFIATPNIYNMAPIYQLLLLD